jgi:STE24 endopeptidase
MSLRIAIRIGSNGRTIVGGMRGRALRIGLSAIAMIVVAEGAVWLLRPRESPIEPATVAEGDYFTAAQLDRARDYRDGQLWLFGAGLLAEGAVLVAVALGRPGAARRALDRLAGRPVLGGAAVGAGLSVAIAVATLPPGIWAHERAVDVGLSTQSLGSWFGDVAKSTAIGAVLAGAGGALLLALVRRWPRRWWIGGSVAVVAIAAVFTWLAPVVLAPLFNRFDALPQSSRVRGDVLALAQKAGVDVGEVYRVDASRRSRALNAYVNGLGSTKRVVLYDTLIDDTDRAELDSIVAHELGHVAHDDILRGLAFVAIVAPFGLLFARETAEAIATRSGADLRTPAGLPALVLALALAGLILNVPGDQLSRKVEASADQFALELTHDPHALIQVQRRLALTNVADPDPPALVTFLLGTHPPTIDRIGAAVAYERNDSTVSARP